jgi:hypothetical protein
LPRIEALRDKAGYVHALFLRDMEHLARPSCKILDRSLDILFRLKINDANLCCHRP